jgi:hypothetical protein
LAGQYGDLEYIYWLHLLSEIYFNQLSIRDLRPEVLTAAFMKVTVSGMCCYVVW